MLWFLLSLSGGAAGKASLTKAEKKKLKAQREAEITAAERARLAGPGAGPETASEYEQQLLAAPNDSYLWIKYMAFQLKLGRCGCMRVHVGRGKQGGCQCLDLGVDNSRAVHPSSEA
jgi:hypothetical protein